MFRRARAVQAGVVHHVLNRGHDRMALFHKDGAYAALEEVSPHPQATPDRPRPIKFPISLSRPCGPPVKHENGGDPVAATVE